ncbi:MAG: MarC family protein [Bacteriovoracaceae bacterium]
MFHSFLISFTGIFVAMDIIGTVPMYLSMTSEMAIRERSLVVNKSMLVALVVAILFMFFGQKVFAHLGITIPDFKIAGGLILLLVSLADLLGGPEAVQKSSGSTGIVPLAVPLITGPGVLTAVILQANTVGFMITLAAILLNFLISWFILLKCETITKLIGKDGTVVISKIAALLLAAISVAMIRSGIFEAIHNNIV